MKIGTLLIERQDGPTPCFRLSGVVRGGERIGEDGLGREYRGDAPLRAATRAALVAAIDGRAPVAFEPCRHPVQRRAR